MLTVEDVLIAGRYCTGGGKIARHECISDNEYIVYCYNGQRFKLTLSSLPDGCKIDSSSGKDIE